MCCVYIHRTDSNYSIQRTLLRNRLVIINKKLQKIKTKTLYARKKENEEEQDKDIHVDAVFAARDHLDVKIA